MCIVCNDKATLVAVQIGLGECVDAEYCISSHALVLVANGA